MKFFVSVILIALLSFAFCLFLPWWSIAIASFAVIALIPQKPTKSFAAGFIALFLLWGILSFIISMNNQHILANKIAMLIIKKQSPYLMIFLTATIGALVSGFASLAASYLRQPKKQIIETL